MNRIAFVFTQSPHGTSAGREGLDALLATSALTNDIGVFFIGDGVLLLLLQQQPQQILARDFITTFKLLSLYEIHNLYYCAESVTERGLDTNIDLILKVTWLSSTDLRTCLSYYNVILTF